MAVLRSRHSQDEGSGTCRLHPIAEAGILFRHKWNLGWKEAIFCETTSNLLRIEFVAKRFLCKTTESRKSILIFQLLLLLPNLFYHVMDNLPWYIPYLPINFNFIKNQAVHSHNTSRSNDLRLPLPRTNWGKQTFIYQAAKDWNSLPNVLRETHLLSMFKSKLKTFLKDFD